MEKESQTIFEKNVIEFVTVAAEFCAFLERAEHMKRKAFVDTSLKILPLLYLKASLLPKCETIGDEAPETYVTEETYEILRIESGRARWVKRMIIWTFSYRIWCTVTSLSPEVHLGRLGRYLSGYQRLYFRFPAGTERNHERLAGHLSGKLRSAVGTEVGKHSACPSRCEV